MRNIILLFTVICITLISCSNLFADIINVPEDYETIQEAVDAAADGDTIQIAPGIYRETVWLVRSPNNLHFQGSGPQETIIDTEGLRGQGIQFQHVNAFIDGIQIRNGQPWMGVVAINADTASVTNCHFNNLGRGVSIGTNATVVINNSIFIDCDTGVHEESTDSCVVSRCLFIGGRIGIAYRRIQNVVDRNTFVGCETAIRVSIGGGITMPRNNVIVDCERGFWAIGGYDNPDMTPDEIIAEHLVIGYQLLWRVEYPFFANLATIPGRSYEGTFDPSPGNDLLFEDPLFRDSEAGDYHLLEDSPCIDAGDPDSPPDPDGTRADMGAFYFHQRDIEVEPLELNFPPIGWGELDSLPVTITNDGGTDLTIINVEGCLCMSCIWMNEENPAEWQPIVMEPLQSIQLWVYYHPQEGAVRSRTFWIHSDDPDEPEITIEATGEVSGIESSEGAVPLLFGVNSAFPNPFNATTTIGFNLPEQQRVSLQLFDLTGRVVETLIDERLEAGRFTAVWNADDFSSGVYFYRIQAGSYSKTIKLALVK